MEFIVKDIALSELSIIKELWEKLNQIHLKDSNYFKEHYQTFTFEKRCEKLYKMKEDTIKIQVICDSGNALVGYCISTIDEGSGEIESLFVEELYRGAHLGKRLVENALDWLKEKGCKKIGVSVAEGHETVFNFYKQFGFYPRLTYLQLK